MKQIILDNDYYSDFENENIIEDENLDVEEFYFYYSNDILDIYEEIKENLSHSPFFFSNLKYPLLTDFIISFVLYNATKLPINKNYLDLFNDYYSVEIESSYNIIQKFLRKFKRNLPYNKWQEFCFKYSDLHELKSNNNF
jgi:hypothetical protein